MSGLDYRTATILHITPYLLVGLAIIVALVGDCSDSSKIDPLDDSIMTSTEVVETLEIRDSKANGFRITYTTARPVTKARFEEIQSREYIQKAFRDMERDAPAYFKDSMLDTDIYDFGEFAKKYDTGEDVKINCIFTIGSKKVAQYARPNPNIPNSAKWIDPNTEQGVLWVKGSDVYNRCSDTCRIYRYWDCHSIYEFSSTDEKMAHFSESERK